MDWLKRFSKSGRPDGQNIDSGKRRHRAMGLLVLAIAGLILGFGVWPVSAAVELLDFRVRSSQSDILLLWNTAHEYDLSGFEVLCKKANEPDTAYHSIGFREAQGGPERGAQYYFLVNQGLTPGQSYCFRLREATTNNQPGEVFDQCGYGLGITPTPPLTTTVAITNTIVLTMPHEITGTTAVTTTTVITNPPGSINATPGAAAGVISPTITPTTVIQPAFTPTPISVSPLQTPVLPTPINPTITPTVTATVTQTVSLGAGIQPPPTPVTPTSTITVTVTSAGTVMPTATLTATQTVTTGVAAVTNTGGADPVNGSAAVTTPDPPYFVVTATPTLVSIALLPVLTPLPTVTPTASFNLAAIAQPGTQSIIILLLCFTFFGASGLGILGLVTSVFYMRSRSTQDRVVSQRRL